MGTVRKPENHPDAVPVFHSTGLDERASDVGDLLRTGFVRMTELFDIEPPRLRAMLLSESDWKDAPREAENPYPFGFPYFTRSEEVPTLVFPDTLSEIFQPGTELTFPLSIWHEIAHAFFLSREVVRTPLWLGEFVPQAVAAAVALREGLTLEKHLSHSEQPDFTVRSFSLPASASGQVRFQNLLLSFAADVIREFGDEFISRLVSSLWRESDVVSEERAEELLAAALGRGGGEWLSGRREFR